MNIWKRIFGGARPPEPEQRKAQATTPPPRPAAPKTEPKPETPKPLSVQPAKQSPAPALEAAGWKPISRPTSPDDIVAAVTQSMLARQASVEQDKFETGEKNPARILCSDNECPCTDQQPLVIGRTAYLSAPRSSSFARTAGVCLRRT